MLSITFAQLTQVIPEVKIYTIWSLLQKLKLNEEKIK